MATSVAIVAVSIVSDRAPRNSGSLMSCRTPAMPPAPTRPTSGATRKSRNNDASNALTIVANGESARRHRPASGPALSTGSVTKSGRHVRANEQGVVERVDVGGAHHTSPFGREKKCDEGGGCRRMRRRARHREGVYDRTAGERRRVSARSLHAHAHARVFGLARRIAEVDRGGQSQCVKAVRLRDGLVVEDVIELARLKQCR